MGHTSSMRRALVAAVVVVGVVAACDRERVEVGEVTGLEAGADGAPSDGPSSPVFPQDAQLVVDAGCAKETPPVTVCDECPKGFKIIDGSPTCDCCE